MHRLCCCKDCSVTSACCSSIGKSKAFDRSSFGTGCKCCQYPVPCCNNISSFEMLAAAGLGRTCVQFSTVKPSCEGICCKAGAIHRMQTMVSGSVKPCADQSRVKGVKQQVLHIQPQQAAQCCTVYQLPAWAPGEVQPHCC